MLKNQELSATGEPVNMKNELDSLILGLEDKEKSLESQQAINKNNIKQLRTNIINSLFELLKNFGVDGSNLESINAFLMKLRAQDPDLAELFNIAFTDLMSKNDNEKQQEELAKENEYKNAGLMNNFRNLGETVLRQ